MTIFGGDVRIQRRVIRFKMPNSACPFSSIANVSVRGKREASGFAVTIDPSISKIRLYCDERMLSYDFSRFSVIDPSITGKPLPDGVAYKPIEGGTLKEILSTAPGRVIFACSGETDDMWAENSMMIVNGNLIIRKAPGVNAKQKIPLDGSYAFFSFDADKAGLHYLGFLAGKLISPLDFQNGIRGPVIISMGRSNVNLLKKASPNIGQNDVLWDPLNKQSAMTAVGLVSKGEVVFVTLAGDPSKNNEILLSDMTNALLELGASEAILLGMSGDVQQYIRMPGGKDHWLVAKPRLQSSMAQMFPGGRPLSSAIIVEG